MVMPIGEPDGITQQNYRGVFHLDSEQLPSISQLAYIAFLPRLFWRSVENVLNDPRYAALEKLKKTSVLRQDLPQPLYQQLLAYYIYELDRFSLLVTERSDVPIEVNSYLSKNEQLAGLCVVCGTARGVDKATPLYFLAGVVGAAKEPTAVLRMIGHGVESIRVRPQKNRQLQRSFAF